MKDPKCIEMSAPLDQRVLFDDLVGTLWETKVFGFGGSMVAKLKLKGIDGRAPPGVEPAA